MRYGTCLGLSEFENIKIAKEAGFDYIECGFCALSRESDEAFGKYKAALEENGLKCEAANGFLPKDLPIIGKDYDPEKIAAYIEKGMQRGSQIGLKMIAFGSSGARKVPEDVSYAEGFRQLGEFLRNVVSPLAEKYGITIVIEPLRKNECNIINTVKEGTMLAVLADRDNIACLADLYHMVFEGDTYDDIRQLKGSILHGHISNPYSKQGLKRDFPTDAEEFDYQGFVEALEFAGCERCSIEAQCVDYPAEAVKAARLLKSLK